MKKTLAISLTSLAVAAMPVFTTFAEEPSLGGDHDVTVGAVDEPIYSVDINWGDLAFDWRFDTTIDAFKFKGHPTCTQITSEDNYNVELIQEFHSYGLIFSNDTCTNSELGEVTIDKINQGTYYYKWDEHGNTIYVLDSSQNGSITATGSFASEDNYSWTTGKFGNWQNADGGGETFHEYTDSFVGGTPEFINTNYSNYHLDPSYFDYKAIHFGTLELERDPLAELSATPTVNPNDKIGTVTVSIQPGLN